MQTLQQMVIVTNCCAVLLNIHANSHYFWVVVFQIHGNVNLVFLNLVFSNLVKYLIFYSLPTIYRAMYASGNFNIFLSVFPVVFLCSVQRNCVWM